MTGQHPDLDDEAEVGLVVGAEGRLERAAGAALIRQSLFLLLSTTPGERVMRPDYGCALLTLAFSHNDDTTAGLASASTPSVGSETAWTTKK